MLAAATPTDAIIIREAILLLFLFIAMKALSAMEFQKQALQLHSPEQSSQTDIRISASMVTDTNKHTGNQSYEIKN